MKIKNINKYINLYNIENFLFNTIGSMARKRGYLRFDEFYQICMWKSVRQKQKYINNQNKIKVQNLTKIAFNEKDEKQKIKILCKLRGVGIPTASAILTVVFPEKYAIIDIRCLNMLREEFDQKQKIGKNVSLKTWLNYLYLMRKWSGENNISPRKLDMVLFAMHKEKLEKENFGNLY